MAPVEPTLGLVNRVTTVLATARTWEGSPVVDAFAALLAAVPSEQRPGLPAAVGEALFTLRLDAERLRLGLDLVLEFDLFEASDGIARLLRERHEPDLTLRAARLATHPGASQQLREMVDLVADSAFAERPSMQRRIAIVRNSAEEPENDAERLAKITAWPGFASYAHGDPPLLVISPGAGSRSNQLDFALEARRAGARIRRLPTVPVAAPSPGWVSTTSILIEDATDQAPRKWADALPRMVSFDTRGTLGPASREELLRRINRKLPLRSHLRTEIARLPLEAGSPFEEIDAFLSGAFRTNEVAYLGGLSKSTVRRLVKDNSELAPMEFGGSYYWSFPALVGMRVWNYVRIATSRKRLPSDLAGQFVALAQNERTVPLAVTTSGQILTEIEEGTFAGEDGQTTHELFMVAGVIRERFELGGRASAPDLLMPSDHTRVRPDIYGGSPALEGTRITVEAVEAVAARAREAGRRGGEVFDFVRERYPEVQSAVLFDEASDLAKTISAVR